MIAESKSRLIKPSQRGMALFHIYLRWYIGRHFHGLRMLNGQRFPSQVQGPLIVCLNHPSWWDPLTCIMVSRRFLPQAEHYAPMDEAALRRYRFFAKLGLFPVEINTARGAMQFSRYATEILSTPNSVLWLTPEGRFVDPRSSPVVFKDGMASLVSRLHNVTVLPLAIEYVYWDERLPEILVNCGNPVRIDNGYKCTTAQWNETLTAALGNAQGELAASAITRDATHFEALLDGGAGIGAMYDLWQRLRSGLRGERYESEHGSIHRP